MNEYVELNKTQWIELFLARQYWLFLTVYCSISSDNFPICDSIRQLVSNESVSCGRKHLPLKNSNLRGFVDIFSIPTQKNNQRRIKRYSFCRRVSRLTSFDEFICRNLSPPNLFLIDFSCLLYHYPLKRYLKHFCMSWIL